jgi:hypothetical protein
VGVPLTLDATEIGIGTSPSGSSASAPKGNGLKLRVECSSPGSNNVKIVALAGNSTTETTIADGIGNHTVTSCP